MDSLDCYVLALEMLDGDGDSQQVLADLLDDLEEPEKARLARQCTELRKRLNLTTLLLPHESAILLGRDFLEHSWMRVNDRPACDDMVQLVREWHGGLKEALVERRIRQIARDMSFRWQDEFGHPLQPDSFTADWPFGSLWRMMAMLRHTMRRQSPDDENQPSVLLPQFHLVEIMHQSRQFLHIAEHFGQEDWQLGWQVARVKALIAHLLSPAEHSWPK